MPATQQDNLSQFLPDWMKGQGVEITGIDLLLKVHVPLSKDTRAIGSGNGRRAHRALPAPLRPPTVNLLAKGRQPGLRKPVPMSRHLTAKDFDYATDYARYLISQGHEDQAIRDKISDGMGKVIALFHLRRMRDELGVPRDASYVPDSHPHMRKGSGRRPRYRLNDKKIPCPVCQKPIRESNMDTHIGARHKDAVDKAIARPTELATVGSEEVRINDGAKKQRHLKRTR